MKVVFIELLIKNFHFKSLILIKNIEKNIGIKRIAVGFRIERLYYYTIFRRR